MSENATLIAEPRERVGKGTSRALRLDGRTPAVIYGDKKEPITISLEAKEVSKAMHTGSFMSTVYTVQVGKTKHNVIPRDLQLHPVKDTPVHVDFLRVSAKSLIAVNVHVNFLNEEECIGITRGGILNVVRHEVELLVPAGNIPESIEVDLTKFDIGSSIHISDFDLPKGAKATITDRDFTVATIASPGGSTEDDSEDEAVAVEGDAVASEE